MSSIYSAVTALVGAVGTWVSKFFQLFFNVTFDADHVATVTGVSFIGLVCLVIPLVGLGIGIIRRLVKVRA